MSDYIDRNEHNLEAEVSKFSIGFGKPTYTIHIAEGLEISVTKQPPSLFYRKMMELVFGWRFELKTGDRIQGDCCRVK